mgnify:CR=1 FL=1
MTSNNLLKSPSLDLMNTVKLELQIPMLRIPKSSENNKEKGISKRELEEEKEEDSSKKVANFTELY